MNQVATTEQKPLTLRDRLQQMKPEFAKALPGHIPPEKFVRTVQTAVQMAPDIGKACETRGGIQSLMAACTKAATDGLILDNREAALVTFNVNVGDRQNPKWEKHVQYIPMVAGLMKKARNSGDVDFKPPQIVYKNDVFEYDPVNDEVPQHKPDWFGDRGEPIGVYIVCRIKSSGDTIVELMTRNDVMRIAAQSKNSYQYDPAKGKNWGEWWRKTVIRRISKYLPSSADRDEFMAAVERIDDGFEFDATDGGETVPARAPKKRGGAASVLKDVSPQEEPHDDADDAAQAFEEANQQNREDHDPETGEVYDGDAMMPGDDI